MNQLKDTNVMIPIVRKTFPKMIAQELANVQPLGEREDPVEKLLNEEFGGLTIEEIRKILMKEKPENFV